MGRHRITWRQSDSIYGSSGLQPARQSYPDLCDLVWKSHTIASTVVTTLPRFKRGSIASTSRQEGCQGVLEKQGVKWEILNSHLWKTQSAKNPSLSSFSFFKLEVSKMWPLGALSTWLLYFFGKFPWFFEHCLTLQNKIMFQILCILFLIQWWNQPLSPRKS